MIGVPGTSKLSLSTSPLFADIWGFSAVALRTAKEINILGYSMPASDTYAMGYLLANLTGNKADALDINIVLGEPGFTRDRLASTISLALSHRRRVKTPKFSDSNLR